MTKAPSSDNAIRAEGAKTNGDLTPLLMLARRVEAVSANLAEQGGGMSHAELLSLWASRIRSFWRCHPEMYEELAGCFLRVGDPFAAVDCAGEGMELCGDRPLLVYRRALGLARLGARGQAERLVAEHEEAVAGLPDHRPLLARLHKDAWIATRDEEALRRSRDEYAAAAAEPRDDVYYPAVNAATLSVFMGDDEGASKFGTLVREDLAGRGEMNYWELASLAEAELAAGELAAAKDAYHRAVECGPSADQLATTRDQAVLLLERLGFDRDELVSVLGKTRIVCITGHIVDAENRPVPRFPRESVGAVRDGLASVMDKLEPTGAVAGGAAGADLLGCEVLQLMGVEATVVLPMMPEAYAPVSVSPAGDEWVGRFDKVVAAGERLLAFPAKGEEEEGNLWAFGNELILGCARQQALAARGEWEVVAVWDGKVGDGAGGTQDLIARAESLGASATVIDPLDGSVRERGPELRGTAASRLACRWIVHLEGRTREDLWACLGTDEVETAAAPATHRVEIGKNARLEFDSYPVCAGFLAALDQVSASERCGVGIGVGPELEGAGPSREPEYFADASVLAQAALRTSSFLATWECAAIAALHESSDLAFEFAGRTGFRAERVAPFYTVAIRVDGRS